MRVGVSSDSVKNVIIWGNHSSTQYPDVHHATVNLRGKEVAAYDAVKDDSWLKGDFISVSTARKRHQVPPAALRRKGTGNVPNMASLSLFLSDGAAARCSRDQSQEAVQRHVRCQGHL